MRFRLCAAFLFVVALLTASYPLMGGKADLSVIAFTTLPLLIGVAALFELRPSLWAAIVFAVLAVGSWLWGVAWALRAGVWQPETVSGAVLALAPGLTFCSLSVGAAVCAIYSLRAHLKDARHFD
jgi:hypothetical protein